MDQTTLTAGVVAGIVALGKLIDWWLKNHQDKKGESPAAQLRMIDRKLEQNLRETRRTIQLLALEIREVGTTATDALHHAVGPDSKGGLRLELEETKQRVSDIEQWQESETIRERNRLQALQDQARMPPAPGMPRMA